MEYLVTVFIGCAALATLLWLLWPSSASTDSASQPPEDSLIDPSDDQQVAFLIGLAGGDIKDAATARFALRRFEETYGRKATTRDVGIVVGLLGLPK